MNEILKTPITHTTAEMRGLFQKHLGPGRFARTAYRIREHTSEKNIFGLNAYDGEALIGTASLTPLNINGNRSACLLGPLLIAPAYRSRGLGLELIEDTIAMAKQKGFAVTLLVGDLAYYEKAGFQLIAPGSLVMPGPIAPQRLLGYEIVEGALSNLKGNVKGE